MKSIYLIPVLTVILFSCGSKSEPESKKEISEKKDTLVNSDSEVVQEELIEPRKRLPKHGGGWIERNLDNPVFYSENVDELVAKSTSKYVEPDEAMDYEYDFLTAKQISKLTTRELIYYVLAYPASFSQICAEGSFDTTGNFPKISGYLPMSYDSEVMSDLQWSEISKRRDSIIIVLCEFIENNSDRIDDDYLKILSRLDAVEAFPTIMATASEKNSSNFSYLLEFMRGNEYAPFLQSDFYDKMYGENSYYTGNSVPSTPQLRKKIIQMAKDFYKTYNAD